MNVVNAIKSGRPFRRGSWPVDYWFEVVGSGIIDRADGAPMSLGAEDYVADDWVVQEPTVTITARQFWSAFADTLKWYETEARPTFTRFDDVIMSPHRVGEELARRLGLEVRSATEGRPRKPTEGGAP